MKSSGLAGLECSIAGTGVLGVLATHETSPQFALGDAGSSTRRNGLISRYGSGPGNDWGFID